jgi:tripartite-type tricarboxylate transporter receptor subunit TctC
LRQILTSPELREKFQSQAFEAFITSPEEAGKFIAAEVVRFSRLIKTRGITAN